MMPFESSTMEFIMQPTPIAIVNSAGNLVNVFVANHAVSGQTFYGPLGTLPFGESAIPWPAIPSPVVLSTLNGAPLAVDASWYVLVKDLGFQLASTLSNSSLIEFQMIQQTASLDVSLGSGRMVAAAQIEITRRTLYAALGSDLELPSGYTLAASVLGAGVFGNSAKTGTESGDEILVPSVLVVWTPAVPPSGPPFNFGLDTILIAQQQEVMQVTRVEGSVDSFFWLYNGM